MIGGARYDKEGNLLTGRPSGTKRGKKERGSIGFSKEQWKWLRSQEVSYSKTVSKLVDAAILANT